jgi:hypothetical protein
VAVFGSATTVVITWRDRRQRVTEAKSIRLWEAKSAALKEAATLATELARLLPKNLAENSPMVLTRLKKVLDELSTEVAASIASFTGREVYARYQLLQQAIDVIQPEMTDLIDITRARRQKEHEIDQANFEAAAQARTTEVQLMKDSGLADNYTQPMLDSIRAYIDQFLEAIRTDVQKG